jgi:hypothetical protein
MKKSHTFLLPVSALAFIFTLYEPNALLPAATIRMAYRTDRIAGLPDSTSARSARYLKIDVTTGTYEWDAVNEAEVYGPGQPGDEGDRRISRGAIALHHDSTSIFPGG